MSADVTIGKLGGMKSAVQFTFSRGETMIRKTLVNVGITALLGGMALAAQAATVQLKLTDYKYGARTVNATSPVHNRDAGSFTGTITNGGVSASVESYCLELTEYFSFGETNTYTKMDAAAYFGSSSLGTFAGSSKAITLAKLLSVANPDIESASTSAAKADLSAALQLAIWNIRYDNDMTLASGSFLDTSTFTTQATAFLNKAVLLANSDIIYSVHVLSSGRPIGDSQGKQDQVIWERGGPGVGNPVPEPTSLALAFGALGALGFATRRRQIIKA
jgi:hypothetical protein